MHLLLTTTTNLTVMVFSSDGERSQTVLPWQSEKLPFVQHAASVSMGSRAAIFRAAAIWTKPHLSDQIRA